MKLLTNTLCAVVLSIVTTWTSAKPICEVPITWRVGQIDTGFNVTDTYALSAAKEATWLWEQAMGKRLFYYDQGGELPINLVNNGTHQRLRKALAEYGHLDKREKQLENQEQLLKQEIASQKARVEQLSQAIELYHEAMAKYENDIAKINQAGGTNEYTVRQRFERRKAKLQQQREQLSKRQAQLESMDREIKQRTERFNVKADAYNADADRAPSVEAARAGEFVYEEQRYSNGHRDIRQEINVFRFGDRSHLVWVLAHELGHALGLKHPKPGTSAVMATQVSAKDTLGTEVNLTPTDVALLRAACNQ